ncbi:MAG: lactonase family protein [Fimbriimonas sp.]
MTATPADTINFHIGTYTAPDGSKGIYHATLNQKNGHISTPELVAEIKDPSYLAYHPNGKFLFAVQESSEGKISSYAVGAGGKLTLVNTQVALGGGPCHLSVDPSGKFLFTAAYGAGKAASLPIAADGSLGAPITNFQNTGSSVNKGRQEGPHMHFIEADAKGKFVYACDLGTDEILVFKLGKDGSLTLGEPRAAKAPPGGGPRHLAFHPNGKVAFVNNELTNGVTSYAVNATTGALSPIQTLSTLPDGVTKNTTAEIALHPNGKWLYVSNRGHDSIAVYDVTPAGGLHLVEIHKLDVAEPRGFGIDPSGKWLVVGGQNSNDLTALAIDAHGKLKATGQKVKVGKPICIIFAK